MDTDEEKNSTCNFSTNAVLPKCSRVDGYRVTALFSLMIGDSVICIFIFALHLCTCGGFGSVE